MMKVLILILIASLAALATAEICNYNNVYLKLANQYLTNITDDDLPYMLNSMPSTGLFDIVLLDNYFMGQFILYYNGSRVGTTFSTDSTFVSSLSTDPDAFPTVFSMLSPPYNYFVGYVQIPPGLRLTSVTTDPVGTVQWSILVHCTTCYTWQVYPITYASYSDATMSGTRSSISSYLVNGTSSSFPSIVLDEYGRGIDFTTCPGATTVNICPGQPNEAEAITIVTFMVVVLLVIVGCVS